MAGVIWSRRALRNLATIDAYIAKDDPAAATRLVSRLVAAAEGLTTFPNRGRPSVGNGRELPTITPYVLGYVVVEDQVTIRYVRHGRQAF